ncbi:MULTISPECIES: T9SS type A sorting domain-containing protein [unclassified Aureispira]|uniref:T9SS type A sorting domain-containing protein n=1 Tax=unclassified Aureispira TaxID=2649989 RepID=UPI0006986210|nr:MULTISPECIES: T9SS type A sorting domain-containing protein [unclassified Aureispira]WMX16922.1 T9SS type A sorting domain-containing protein [Aureispira sp. CCB-E]
MKNLILLCFLFVFTNYSNAQLRQLTWYKTSPLGNSYTTQNFSVCGNPPQKKFKVAYHHCPQYVNVDCIGGCGNNPIRYTVELQRNGVAVGSPQVFQASSVWSNTFFYNVPTSPGTYRAYVKVERRKPICIGWETLTVGYTNSITVGTTPATPNFNVNGTAIPASGYINTCISNIKINAASTSCETAYYIGVQESNEWWNRTFEYEWGGWISGQAPNNINLQGLATTFGTGARYTGTDASREGNILIGGNLSTGQARFYRVSICTGTPSWQCKTALIRVDPNCRIDPSTITEDTNEYIWIEDNEMAQRLKNESIEASFEADVDNDISALEGNPIGNVTIAPNPFSGSAAVSIDNYEGEAPILFELYNALGERVASIQTNKTQFEIQRNQLSAGIYMYRATVDNELLGSGKVVIE